MCVVGPGAPRARVYIRRASMPLCCQSLQLRSDHVQGKPLPCPRRGATGAMELELELGLAPPNHASSCGKRGSAEAFGVDKATLPLFLRDDDDDDGGDHGSGDARDWEMGNKRKRLVGWPPVKSAHRPRSNGGGHVKVKMEGVPIGRKVDLSRHASYHELHHTLRLMFPSSTIHQDAREGPDRHGCRRGRAPYAMTYEDGDGDWMLVGDAPWEDFAKSAKRLKILM